MTMTRWPLLTYLFLTALASSGQSVFRIDSLPTTGLVLDKGWKWQLGDNPDWAKPNVSDSTWKAINPLQPPAQLKRPPQQGIGWLRLQLRIAPQLRNQLVAINLLQAGATELFLNGRLMVRNGKISPQKRIEQSVLSTNLPTIYFDNDSSQLVAIRYAFSTKKFLERPHVFLLMTLLAPQTAERYRNYAESGIRVQATLFGIFLILGVVQLLLYAASLTHRATLYLGLFLVAQSLTHLVTTTDSLIKTNVMADLAAILAFVIAISLSAFFYLIGIYAYFKQPKKGLFYLTAILTLATIPANLYLADNSYLALFILGFLVPWTDILRVSIIALKQKKSGAKVFMLAHGTLLVVFIVYTLAAFVPAVGQFLGVISQYMFTISFLGLALTISMLLAQERAMANSLLQKQLNELAVLSQKTRAQEQEKQQLLAIQNERLEEQVEQRTAELKTSQTQLIQKEKLASLGELTAGIAHEIQNPLNFVNNFSEVSAELIGELKEEAQAGHTQDVLAIAEDLTNNLAKIHHHWGRASAIVKGMLAHSRTDSGEKRPTSLNALADEYLKIAYQGARANDESFECDLVREYEADLEQVNVVPQEIGRVLLNLYNNAFYAVRERQQHAASSYLPTVTVRTEKMPESVQIRVADNGTGMAESVKAKIFQPFFTTKPTGEGTGLGLSLSYDIITKGHGGVLMVGSQEGQGTEFRITLPIHTSSNS